MEKTIIERRLSHREKQFIHHYLITKTAKEAAEKAGYTCNPGSQASRLLRRDKVKKAICLARSDLAERNGVTQDKVLRMMVSSYERGAEEGDVMGMLKSAKEIGKICGFYPTAAR